MELLRQCSCTFHFTQTGLMCTTVHGNPSHHFCCCCSSYTKLLTNQLPCVLSSIYGHEPVFKSSCNKAVHASVVCFYDCILIGVPLWHVINVIPPATSAYGIHRSIRSQWKKQVQSYFCIGETNEPPTTKPSSATEVLTFKGILILSSQVN